MPRLGIGFIGSGFITQFHIRSFAGVRNADIKGIWSPHLDHARSTAALAQSEGVGDARAYPSIRAMVADPAIDAIWICGPNFSRLSNIEEITDAIREGVGTLRGIACEKPLARNVAEAEKILRLVQGIRVPTGYLENQVFMPSLVRAKEILWKRGAMCAGRPYLARATEEHGGPHSSWFWRGEAQGGGALNDMMCHAIEATRFMLTDPGKDRSSVRPKNITARTANLKWSQPKYAKAFLAKTGVASNSSERAVEDYASATVEFVDDYDNTLFAELTTSWSYVGPGLRITMELLGPEYSMAFNSLECGPKMFLSREVTARGGEDFVEKQNAEAGLMPIVSNEVSEYGYEAENRHMVQAFLTGQRPLLTFKEGFEVVQLLMTAYMSAEQGRTIECPPQGLASYVPAVACK